MDDCPIISQLQCDRLKWDDHKLGGQKNAIKMCQVVTLEHWLQLLGKTAIDGAPAMPQLVLRLLLFPRKITERTRGSGASAETMNQRTTFVYGVWMIFMVMGIGLRIYQYSGHRPAYVMIQAYIYMAPERPNSDYHKEHWWVTIWRNTMKLHTINLNAYWQQL